jgi:5-methylcytosine-specific restriction endonuclease McrA
MTTITFDHLSNEQLAAEIKRVAGVERRSTADLLQLLIEVERRDLHLTLGYSSMFVYCVRALHLSEQAAYSRITAARAVRRFPTLVELLAEGALTLSSVGLLAPHLTDETLEPLLEAARGKSTRDVERLIAALHPQPDIPASVRALPPPEAETLPIEASPAPAAVLPASAPVVPAPSALARPVIAPLAPTRYLLRLTIGQETHDKLERVRSLLRHAVPDGDLATIVDRALTLLLRDAERAKHARTERPKTTEAEGTSGRHVPAAVKRAVWSRDGGRCAFEGTDGRCGESAFLEFHHVVPFATGGPTNVENLQLRCRAHNQHEATLFFGVGPSP